MTTEEPTNDRAVTVKIARKYHREMRRVAVEHELSNAQVLCWALDLLVRYERDGGLYAPG